jgi:hypothetical protein
VREGEERREKENGRKSGPGPKRKEGDKELHSNGR